MPLEDYKVEHPEYQYIVPSTVPQAEKVALLGEFLIPYRDSEEYDFQNSSNGSENDPITYFIAFPRFDGAPKLLIQISTGKTQRAESKAIQNAWNEILQLSCKLEDRWNGSVYHVAKRRSLKCKEMILEEFLHKYEGFQVAVVSDYDGGKALQLTASYGSSNTRLVLYYQPERVEEKDRMLAMVSESETKSGTTPSY